MNEGCVSSLSNEFEASVLMGSGLIGVVGPAGSGKTRAVLDFLAERDEHQKLEWALASRRVSRGREHAIGKHREGLPIPRHCHVEYWTARSFSNDVISQLVYRIQHSLAMAKREEAEEKANAESLRHENSGKRRRPYPTVVAPTVGLKRRRLDMPVSELSSAITSWLAFHPEGSELHLVIDDADHLTEDNAIIDRWLSACLLEPVAWSRSVFLWLVSQVPRRLPSCFRWHLLRPPSAMTVSTWVDSDFRMLGDESSRIGGNVVVKQFVRHAVQHYRTHRPSSASLVVRDIRPLLQRVYDRLPALIELVTPQQSTANGEATGALRLPNALHYAKAWALSSSIASGSADEDDGEEGVSAPDLLCRALQRVGHTAVLLAFSAFYCGAVSKQQQQRALGDTSESIRRTHRRQNSSAAAASAGSAAGLALSSSTFSFTASQLAAVYRALLPMCTASIDPIEFETASWACGHLLPRLVSWGLITTGTRTQVITYHCWIPLTTAVQLTNMLGISLYQLIPV